uniref:Ribitol-5-phosphate transferase FKTN N-terminal domain-containing protein n=1 Tax=Ixodes ricinus TaxID=34613 RepID=A0A147BN45_IXORI
MTRKAARLICLLACGAALLILQSFVLQYLFRQQEKEPVQHISPIWEVIKDVTGAAEQSGFPLFVLDQNALQCFVEKPSLADRSSCSSALREQTVVQFGSLGQFASQKEEDFTALLSKAGYRTSRLAVPNPRVLAHGLEVLIPTNYFVTLGDLTLHIVVFHERPGNFWWHAAAAETDRGDSNGTGELWSAASAPTSELRYLRRGGAYDKVEILPLDLGGGVRTFAPARPEAFLEEQPFVECNATRARAFHDQHGRDESPEAELFRLKVHGLLAKVQRLLDHLGVPFWISSGTCLGFYRQCDVIPYTTDVDIGIFIRDYKPDMVSLFSTHDLPLTHLFGKVEDSYELSFRDRDVKLDVFFFYEEDSYVWNGGTQARTGKKFKYVFPKFQLCWTEFLDLKLRVPCETERYIEANYGASWFTPLKKWDWKASPPNVEENGAWPVEEWPQVIQLFPLPDS